MIHEDARIEGGRKRSGKMLFLAFLSIILVVILCWIDLADESASKYLDVSLRESLVIYGIARSINALISVLQTTHFPGFLTIGQTLDPLNSLIERFSALMELAIGSLVIQKVLVEVFADIGFKFLVTMVGLLLGVAIIINNRVVIQFTSKIFISVVFLRLVLVTIIFMCGWVNNVFINEKINKDRRQVEWANSEVVKYDDLPLKNEIPDAKDDAVGNSLNEDSTEVKSAKDGVTKGFFEAAMNKLDKMRDKVKEAANRIKDGASKFNPIEIKKRMESFVPNILHLMAYFFLKTILLPVIFFYVCKRTLLVVWDIDLASLLRRNAS